MLPIIFLTACNSSRKISKDYLYFKSGADTVDIQQKETVIQPNDLLSIQVFSRTINQEQAAIFNIPNTNNVAATGYQVDLHGNIEMPIIGSIKAVGLTKDQLQTLLAKKLSDYVKNPSVLVRFFQFNVNVLGEVRTPGTQKFLVDRVTIIDAIGSAGDLTDYGKREDVTVIREENGKKIFQRVDLRRKDIFESPVYLLQPNDIVYVGANNKKLKALNVDVDTQRTTGLIFSIVSIAATLTSLIVTFSR
ncbi:polysaccharide biosynthesis/export family protein [Segetibacter koreensis]|uniref:polysaccharide biosynthesis/export family protein n=1 Tax=Segetibacter koreensis TaxID=398037 RepID=UPI000477E002|nr:polysaccharide biosynthesis/export family protein [Segetibacter koreensis]